MKNKPRIDDILQALQDAVGSPEMPVEEPDEGATKLGCVGLGDFADHARGVRPFSEEQLAHIRCHPIRQKLLASFERQYGRMRCTTTIADCVRRWREAAGCLQPLAIGVAEIAGQPNLPTYTLLIEREGLLLEESSVQMIFAPQVTERGMLVFQVGLSPAAAELIRVPSIRAELSVFAAAQEFPIGRVEVTGPRTYVNIPLPSEIRNRPEWRELRPGGPLPFALILHVSEVHLEAATAPLKKFAKKKSSRSKLGKLLLEFGWML